MPVRTPIFIALFLAAAVSFAETEPSHLSRGLIRIEYAQSDEAVARSSLEILDRAIAEFAEHLPAGVDPIQVKICHSYADFKRLAGEYGMARVGGMARSHSGIIIVKAPHLLPPGQDYRGMLRHELIHVLLARNTDEVNVPRWFDEGVAMVVSKEMRWESGFRVARMYVSRRLIPYLEMNMAFAPLGDEQLFDDAYAQALSITHYLIDEMGEARFWELVRSLKTTPFEEALRTYAGMTPAALYDGWRGSLWKFALITSLVSGFSAFQFMAILLVIAFLRKRRRGRKLLAQWEEEENEPPVFHWEDVVEGPYSWEEEDEEDER